MNHIVHVVRNVDVSVHQHSLDTDVISWPESWEIKNSDRSEMSSNSASGSTLAILMHLLLARPNPQYYQWKLSNIPVLLTATSYIKFIYFLLSS